MEYKGYRYVLEIDEDEDVRKYNHFAYKPGGSYLPLDLSPYVEMDMSTFEHFIDLGFPTRMTEYMEISMGGISPLRPSDLEEMGIDIGPYDE